MDANKPGGKIRYIPREGPLDAAQEVSTIWDWWRCRMPGQIDCRDPDLAAAILTHATVLHMTAHPIYIMEKQDAEIKTSGPEGNPQKQDADIIRHAAPDDGSVLPSPG